jgi:hypothetical protein
MSIEIMTAVWRSGPRDQGELLVLLALAERADKTGLCWPGLAEIADRSRVTIRSAQRILRRLEAGDWLAVEAGGGRTSNRYRINLAALTQSHPTPDAQSSHPRRPRHLTPDARVTPPLTPVSPEPSLNHHGTASEARAPAAYAPEVMAWISNEEHPQ